MPDLLPSPSDARILPIDQVAFRLLGFLRKQDNAGTQLHIRNVINTGASGGVIPQPEMDEFLSILTEAWDWLVARGLIAGSHPRRQPGEGHTFITRRGNAILDDPHGPARLAAELRLAVDLHQEIRDKVRPQFLLGEYELAAFAALKQVEVRVRKLASASDSLVGVKLMTSAFRDGGALSDTSLDPGERVAMMGLFQGAIGVFKNPPSHRPVEYSDPTEASEVVLLADLLLRLLDRVEERLNSDP